MRAGKRRASPGQQALLGGLAGLVGTAAMTAAMHALWRRLPEHERYPLPPREIVDALAPLPSEEELEDSRHQAATMLAHFGYGAGTGALFAVATGSRDPAAGAAYGVLVWAASYLGWIPAAGVLRPAWKHPARRNLLMIAVHLVWGATTAITLKELEKASAGAFARDQAGEMPRDTG